MQESTLQTLKNLTWETECQLIRSDPISVARCYEHLMSRFFSALVVSCPDLSSKIADYAWVEELQKRGASHRHAFVGIRVHLYLQSSVGCRTHKLFDTIINCQHGYLPDALVRLWRHSCSLVLKAFLWLELPFWVPMGTH